MKMRWPKMHLGLGMIFIATVWMAYYFKEGKDVQLISANIFLAASFLATKIHKTRSR